MAKKKFKFRANSRYKDLDAQRIGEYLEEHFKDKDPTPADVVELAKNHRSPLHGLFEWDEKVAADKYRIVQARNLLCSIYVIDNGSTIKAFENVYLQEIDKKTYMATDKIAAREDLWQQVVDAALRELNYWRMKHAKYREHFPAVFAAIEETERKRAKKK